MNDTTEKLKNTTPENREFLEGLEIARANPHWNCRFHPTNWWHEVGCPHQKWTVEQLQDALEGSRAVVRVLQHKLLGLSLDGNPIVVINNDQKVQS